MKKQLCVLACGMWVAGLHANDQVHARGFLPDSHLDLSFRNAYMDRDHGYLGEKAEWGQTANARFVSGYTQGAVGIGVDAFVLSAVNLDRSAHQAGDPGIDFFKPDAQGRPAHDLLRTGVAVKARVSSTVITYGDQMPRLPVLSADTTRLLPESYTGVLVTSQEVDGLVLHAGRFTREARKSADGRDSGGLGRIDVLGGSYAFNEQLTASLYASENKNVAAKRFARIKYVLPLQDARSLTFNLNGYRTRLNKAFAVRNFDGGRDNTIWSLSANYVVGAHGFLLAHQRSSGDTGYHYGWYQNAGGLGDGGATIWLANSYWSDFDGEDERSWQARYSVDLGKYGLTGLSYLIAYVTGSDIKTAQTDHGHEHEVFNQLRYIVQSGPAKGLAFKLRASWLHVSGDAHAYFKGGKEVRVFVDYPLQAF